MKKKFVVLLIVFTVFATNLTFASATQYEMYAEKLASINVFKGTGNGYELDREPTRIEGVIMLIRLLGKEDDALAQSEEPSEFTDVPSWAVKYTNYAKKNGLTNGIGNDEFGSNMNMNAKSYYTYLLRALGYDDSVGDFSWDSAVEFALDLNMISDEMYIELGSDEFLRDHVAKSSYDALFTNMKGQSETLLNGLVASGDIDASVAANLEIVEVRIAKLDKEAEYIAIVNNGLNPVDISGWTVVSVKGNQTFTFPDNTTINAGQTLKLISGDKEVPGDYEMASTHIWNNGSRDDAKLLDSEGNEVDYLIDTAS